MSPPPGEAEDGIEEAGDLDRIGRSTRGVAPVARLVAKPIGALAAGPAAVPAPAPGARPAQLGAAHRAARRPVTKRARFVTHRGVHAIRSAICGVDRAALRAAIWWRSGSVSPSP